MHCLLRHMACLSNKRMQFVGIKGAEENQNRKKEKEKGAGTEQTDSLKPSRACLPTVILSRARNQFEAEQPDLSQARSSRIDWGEKSRKGHLLAANRHDSSPPLPGRWRVSPVEDRNPWHAKHKTCN